MDKEELKKRTKLDWRKYIPEKEALDALVREDATKLTEIKTLATKAQAWEDALHASIDAAANQTAVDTIANTFTYPTRATLDAS